MLNFLIHKYYIWSSLENRKSTYNLDKILSVL